MGAAAAAANLARRSEPLYKRCVPAGIGVVSTGHSHPKVVKAIQDQAARVIHPQQNIFPATPPMVGPCAGLRTSGCKAGRGRAGDRKPGVQAALLDRLLKICPSQLTRFFFANSGSEAVDNAIKVARAHTGKQNIICFEVRPPPASAAVGVLGGGRAPFQVSQLAMPPRRALRPAAAQNSFHGRTYGAMAITTSKTYYRQGFSPLMPSVSVAPYPYCLHCKARACAPDGDEWYKARPGPSLRL